MKKKTKKIAVVKYIKEEERKTPFRKKGGVF